MPTEATKLFSCDGVIEESHEWGPDRRFVAHGGPTDGEWIVASCLRCNAGRISPASGGSGLELIIAKLAELGCDPQPVENVS
jgi:hypothetical protein